MQLSWERYWINQVFTSTFDYIVTWLCWDLKGQRFKLADRKLFFILILDTMPKTLLQKSFYIFLRKAVFYILYYTQHQRTMQQICGWSQVPIQDIYISYDILTALILVFKIVLSPRVTKLQVPSSTALWYMVKV